MEDINTLKYFIKNANKEKLAEITQNNPTYFYDILPYAYALGLSIRWIEKFKDTTLNVPKWYFDNYFDIKVLKSFIFETIPYIVKNDKETDKYYKNYENVNKVINGIDRILNEWNKKGIKAPEDIKNAMEKEPEAPLYETSVMNFDWLNEK